MTLTTHFVTRLLRCLILLFIVTAASAACADDPEILAAVAEAAAKPVMDADQRLQVTDPYLEMHTGAGRGYPVFFVVPRGAGVWIILRHTDWYKVQTEEGKEGWVQREQLESTLTAAGAQKTFRDILLGA